MANPSSNSERGYFNALTATYFQTGADGRRLFFPWGALGRGYIIPSEPRYESLRRQTKAYMVAALMLVVAPAALQFYVTGIIVAAGLIVFYFAWVPYLLRGLEPSEERLSLTQAQLTQARTHSAGTLWAMEIGSLVFVAIGIAMLILEPQKWLLALGSIVMFGFCAIMIGRMILLRRRAASGPT